MACICGCQCETESLSQSSWLFFSKSLLLSSHPPPFQAPGALQAQAHVPFEPFPSVTPVSDFSGIMKDIANEGQGTLSLDVWRGWQARMGRGAGEVDLLSSLLTVDIFVCTSQGQE